jgi:hypothetical protein
MDVTLGAIDFRGGHIEHVDGRRSVEVAWGPELDVRVATAHDQRRQPTDLEIQPGVDEEARARKRDEQAGLGLDEVRILIAASPSTGRRQ